MSGILVASPKYIFVLIEDRAAFDKIDRPLTDNGPNTNGHVITKSVEQDGVLVVFQHWLQYIEPALREVRHA